MFGLPYLPSRVISVGWGDYPQGFFFNSSWVGLLGFPFSFLFGGLAPFFFPWGVLEFNPLLTFWDSLLALLAVPPLELCVFSPIFGPLLAQKGFIFLGPKRCFPSSPLFGGVSVYFLRVFLRSPLCIGL